MTASRIVFLLCLAETLSMTGFAAYPAFLPVLREVWQFNDTQAGFVGGSFFFGYMLAVPFLSGITDRLDARNVFVFSCALAAFGTAGFALFADGLISAALFQALTGAGLAGTYMPGLKALTDRTNDVRQARYIAFYTATFGIGTSLSLLAAGWLGNHVSWQISIAVLSLGPVLAGLILLFGLPSRQTQYSRHAPWWPRFAPVLAQKEIRPFIFGYAAHCWELFGLRSWMVAFITFAYFVSESQQAKISPTEAAALINLLGLPASILGNEVAERIGRYRWICAIMLISGALCWVAGFSAAWPWWLMLCMLALHYTGVLADSATLTAGLVAATPLAQRGAVMALYSLLGFGSGFLAPLVFGAILDISGGHTNRWAWGMAYGSLGVGGLIWATIMRRRISTI
ncbi:MAG: MFS transporter [Sterolibacterium sp.]